MKPDQKSESPAATGLNANQKHLPNTANSATDPVPSKAVSYLKRIARFIQLCFIQCLISRALWVDHYENFKPRHGK